MATKRLVKSFGKFPVYVSGHNPPIMKKEVNMKELRSVRRYILKLPFARKIMEENGLAPSKARALKEEKRQWKRLMKAMDLLEEKMQQTCAALRLDKCFIRGWLVENVEDSDNSLKKRMSKVEYSLLLMNNYKKQLLKTWMLKKHALDVKARGQVRKTQLFKEKMALEKRILKKKSLLLHLRSETEQLQAELKKKMARIMADDNLRILWKKQNKLS